ncbi:MAG: hypothetical protein QXU40_01195 [Candidatus Pacearchaeota archaeon]
MSGWQGWIAALGGLIALISQWVTGAEQVLLWVGSIVAILFGILASTGK